VEDLHDLSCTRDSKSFYGRLARLVLYAIIKEYVWKTCANRHARETMDACDVVSGGDI
jgi:hypothetical protein